ncbi:hypothetical protein AGMMS49928_24140 [Spirochaetia bacterium]|nr:hypothetical protein AGMMS49928_24140 [Spirochaetia bacterium]
MKKTLFGLLTVSMVLVLACKSAPPAEPEAPPAAPTEYTQENANADFEKLYSQYEGKIILEGATPYTVIRGDSLSRIANTYYGSANNYGYFFPLIVMASDTPVPDPDMIDIGMQLTVPDLKRNLDNPEARAAIKAFLKDVALIYNRKNNLRSASIELNLIALADSL